MQNLVIRRPFLEVHFNKLPPNHSLPIDGVSRWMRPALPVRIENPVEVDDLVVFVLEHGKIEIARESFLEFLDKLF